MRSLIRIRRKSLWPVLTLACGLLAAYSPCRGEDDAAGDKPAIKTEKKPAAKAEKKKAEDSMQKALQEAQSAYEKEQKEMKERLEKDPAWQPTHENVAVIKPGKGPIESFCRNKDGNLLICCSGEQPSLLGSILGGKSTSPRGGVFVFSPEGKKIAAWKVPLRPQAICLGSDGAIYVAGGGRIAKLDQSGKVVAETDAPNTRELPALLEVKKEPKKEGPEAEAAEKAKKEKIARLTKEMQQAQKDYMKAVREGQKDLKPGDDASAQAFQEKIGPPMQKLQAVQQEFQEATMTPKMRAAQARAMRERMTTVTGMAVTDRDLFVCCASTKGFGYTVWRTDHDFAHAKKIVENLAGCCSQMDIQAHGGDLWVAHNSRHKVEHYSREGKKLGSFGKTDRTSADGFGGCCEPKNLRFGAGDVVLCCESGPPTCVKRFSLSGKFLGVSLVAPWNSGCVRVTTEYDAANDRYFVLNSGEQQIHVFAKKPGTETPPATDRSAGAPPRVLPDKPDPQAAQRAMELYDANMDGFLDAKELEKVPGLRAALRQVDLNNDGKISAADISARIQAWAESKLGRMGVSCRVKHNGRPLAGATVKLVPETFLGAGMRTYEGTSDDNGTAKMFAAGTSERGVSPGFYRVKITKTGEAIPSKYNTETFLGQEVAIDAAGLNNGVATIDLKY